MKAYIADIETNGLLDQLDKVHCFGVINIETREKIGFADQPGYRPISEGLKLLAEADLIVGHNWIRFDAPALRKVFPTFKSRAVIRDTMIGCSIVWPDLYPIDQKLVARGQLPPNLMKRRSLKAWGYRLKNHKDEYTGGWDEWSPQMHEYMLQDLEVTLDLWLKILSKAPSEAAMELEHEFQQIIFEQEVNGFCFDFDEAVKLQGRLAKRRAELETQLIDQFGSWWQGTPQNSVRAFNRKREDLGNVTRPRFSKTGRALKPYVGPVIETLAQGPWTKIDRVTFNPGSRDHIAKMLIERLGWKPKDKTDGGKWVVDEDTLGGLDIPAAKPVVEFLTVVKRLGQLADGDQAWLKCARRHPEDGTYRVHHECNTLGAMTARVTHSRPNMSAVPSVRNAKGVVPYGKECRALFKASPGYVQVGADASGIQIRCLAHYLARYDGGNYVNTILTGDVHALTRDSVGLGIDREKAKRLIYAYLFGGGDMKLGEIVSPTAKPAVQRKLGKEAKAKMEANIPGLQALQRAIRQAACKGCIMGLDGRIMPLRAAHTALASLLQSAEAIIMKRATVLLHRHAKERGWIHGQHYRQVAFVHDEIQSEVRPEIADEFGKLVVSCIVEAGHHYNFRCPLAGEFKVGANWADCH